MHVPHNLRVCVRKCGRVCVCEHVVYVCHACRIHLASALPASAACAGAGAAFQLSKQKYKTLSRTNVHFN